ncbi:hypothetical protein Q3G72_027811 [Acer saccharum]|nr:hypothetical protein Q3G72_027811 [Acer saccharum]
MVGSQPYPVLSLLQYQPLKSPPLLAKSPMNKWVLVQENSRGGAAESVEIHNRRFGASSTSSYSKQMKVVHASQYHLNPSSSSRPYHWLLLCWQLRNLPLIIVHFFWRIITLLHICFPFYGCEPLGNMLGNFWRSLEGRFLVLGLELDFAHCLWL